MKRWEDYQLHATRLSVFDQSYFVRRGRLEVDRAVGSH